MDALTRTVRDILRGGSRALGCKLCFHDYERRLALPAHWRTHDTAACRQVKRKRETDCLHYAQRVLRARLGHRPEGEVLTCPAGLTEIVVPVYRNRFHVGMLFGGVFWCGKEGAAPRGARAHPPRDWLRDRRTMLRAVATRIGEVLSEEAHPGDRREERRAAILGHLRDRVGEPAGLRELARDLHLSPSRTGHVIRELFGITFPALKNRVRLLEAARLLESTSRPLAEIALAVGYRNQSQFTNHFSRQYGTPPGAYRRGRRRGV